MQVKTVRVYTRNSEYDLQVDTKTGMVKGFFQVKGTPLGIVEAGMWYAVRNDVEEPQVMERLHLDLWMGNGRVVEVRTGLVVTKRPIIRLDKVSDYIRPAAAALTTVS